MLVGKFVFLLIFARAQCLQVNTTEGVMEGHKANDGDYYAFYDIPYAGPTDGSNRFKAPIPPSAYTEVFNATNRNITCAQPALKGLVGIENCLTLSIFTNNVTNQKPVIVFLNSEEYTTTDTRAFSYKRFVEENIVFITINFRLSIFGFLCLGVQEAPGNAGLKDVIQGLNWINANVANFGGTPSNVVLMGHGSGAAIVDILTMTPLTNNLIHKAVALSGSVLAPWAIAYEPIIYAKALGRSLGYDTEDVSNLAKNFTTTDLNVLVSSMNQFKFTNNTPLFAPCLENSALNLNDTVLVEAPIHLLRTGNYSQIPYIASFTTEEGTMRATEEKTGRSPDIMERNFQSFLPVDLNFRGNKTAIKSIYDFYFDGNIIYLNYYFSYEGDILVAVPVVRGVKERGGTSSADVRLLEFDYMGAFKDWRHAQLVPRNLYHGVILNYLFDYNLDPSDKAVMRSLVKRFAGFAYTGNPVATTGVYSTSWPALTVNTVNYLYFGGDSITGKLEAAGFNMDAYVMKFWDEIYKKYYVPPKTVGSADIYMNNYVPPKPVGSGADRVQPVSMIGGLFLVILSQVSFMKL